MNGHPTYKPGDQKEPKRMKRYPPTSEAKPVDVHAIENHQHGCDVWTTVTTNSKAPCTCGLIQPAAPKNPLKGMSPYAHKLSCNLVKPTPRTSPEACTCGSHEDGCVHNQNYPPWLKGSIIDTICDCGLTFHHRDCNTTSYQTCNCEYTPPNNPTKEATNKTPKGQTMNTRLDTAEATIQQLQDTVAELYRRLDTNQTTTQNRLDKSNDFTDNQQDKTNNQIATINRTLTQHNQRHAAAETRLNQIEYTPHTTTWPNATWTTTETKKNPNA